MGLATSVGSWSDAFRCYQHRNCLSQRDRHIISICPGRPSKGLWQSTEILLALSVVNRQPSRLCTPSYVASGAVRDQFHVYHEGAKLNLSTPQLPYAVHQHYTCLIRVDNLLYFLITAHLSWALKLNEEFHVVLLRIVLGTSNRVAHVDHPCSSAAIISIFAINSLEISCSKNCAKAT